MCGAGSKICPPERDTEFLEASIEPGDRVVMQALDVRQEHEESLTVFKRRLFATQRIFFRMDGGLTL
jgi:hypothetical protein